MTLNNDFWDRLRAEGFHNYAGSCDSVFELAQAIRDVDADRLLYAIRLLRKDALEVPFLKEELERLEREVEDLERELEIDEEEWYR